VGCRRRLRDLDVDRFRDELARHLLRQLPIAVGEICLDLPSTYPSWRMPLRKSSRMDFLRRRPPTKKADFGILLLRNGRRHDAAQRTQLINAVRGHLSEYGIVAECGLLGLAELAGDRP
jgi:hypothetical protein